MLASFLAATVDFSRRYAKTIVLAALVLCFGMGAYIAGHLSMNTDINQLLSEELGWRQREKALEKAFPHKVDTMVIVIDGDTGDKAESAAASLAAKLAAMPDQFTFVSRPDALPFFRTNGILYLPVDELASALDRIAQAQPMLGTVIGDPSLRGFLGTIGLMVQGVQAGAADPAQIERPMAEIAAAFSAAAQGKEHRLDWRKMMPAASNDPFAARELRKFIIVKPVLDFSALQPGEAATKIVRQTAAELQLNAENGVRVRLTGSVPLNDEEFASVAEGAGLATALSGLLVIGLLFLAMRTWRIVLPITLTLIAGLVASTAFAAFAVGSLNLISVAFAVMFIGIAVDFGIQFGVRYRDQRFAVPDHAEALRRTASLIAVPLAMAAAATALGFLSFIPTDYRGVSELGIIAGAGMAIAFALNVTLLPALMTLMKPPAEAESAGYASLAPINDFLRARRRVLLPVVGIVAVIACVLAAMVRFDFDPLNLKNPETESVSTMFEAMQDPDSDAYAAQILVSSQEEAQKLADGVAKLPEVDHAMTMASFIPEDQDKKLAMIADTAALLEPTFALTPLPAASDADNLDALRKAESLLRSVQDKMPAAKQLADALDQLATQNSPEALKRAQDNVLVPMQAKLEEIRGVLQAKKVAFDDIPSELRRDWIAPDGRWLVEIFPKRNAQNDPRDPLVLEEFVAAVRAVEPMIGGTPVSIQESGHTVVSAFVQAGIYGCVSIALLSFIVLRRARDVLTLFAPLALAGLMTLATMTAIHLPLNFANIIALPLLLSLGVSYAVYFVFFARSGRRDFLQSGMARAVLFSAATVLVAFISLCFSTHPGTNGMGKLLTIALLYCVVCTFLVLPVLYDSQKEDTNL